jgi:hypothetical protein
MFSSAPKHTKSALGLLKHFLCRRGVNSRTPLIRFDEQSESKRGGSLRRIKKWQAKN